MDYGKVLNSYPKQVSLDIPIKKRFRRVIRKIFKPNKRKMLNTKQDFYFFNRR